MFDIFKKQLDYTYLRGKEMERERDRQGERDRDREIAREKRVIKVHMFNSVIVRVNANLTTNLY